MGKRHEQIYCDGDLGWSQYSLDSKNQGMDGHIWCLWHGLDYLYLAITKCPMNIPFKCIIMVYYWLNRVCANAVRLWLFKSRPQNCYSSLQNKTRSKHPLPILSLLPSSTVSLNSTSNKVHQGHRLFNKKHLYISNIQSICHWSRLFVLVI